ncbi:MAG: hypothetical protein IT204_22960 [Fimbriimonadaceae bacterium]|nr:hypothetical protein [Fimbriimonadaceae bacterium]
MDRGQPTPRPNLPRERLLAELQKRRQAPPPVAAPALPAPAPEPRGGRPAPLRVGDLCGYTDPLAASPQCLPPRQVEEFVAGRLRGAKQAAVRTHLLQCPHCRGYATALREAGARPFPTVAPSAPSRPVLGTSHILGLTVAFVLLLLANSAVIDYLGTLDQAPTAAATVAAPVANQTVLAPLPAAPVAPVSTPNVPAVTAPDLTTLAAADQRTPASPVAEDLR